MRVRVELEHVQPSRVEHALDRLEAVEQQQRRLRDREGQG